LEISLEIKNCFRKINMKSAKTVEEYLSLSPEQQQKELEKIRKAIRDAAPKAEEAISYGMPVYKLNGVLVYFGGFKNHCSFFPAGNSAIQKFSNELKSYKTSKGTIQFPLNEAIPVTLIKKIVKERIRENENRQKEKASKKNAAVKKSSHSVS
jgi:uncharacterized protein YdhG (YjbR/CyaY superfamily)